MRKIAPPHSVLNVRPRPLPRFQRAQNFGCILCGDEAVTGSATRFASRENTTVALRPRLTITDSIPATLAHVPLLPWPAGLLRVTLRCAVGGRFLRPRSGPDF